MNNTGDETVKLFRRTSTPGGNFAAAIAAELWLENDEVDAR